MVMAFTPDMFGSPNAYLDTTKALQNLLGTAQQQTQSSELFPQKLAQLTQDIQQTKDIFPAKLALTQAQAKREQHLADMPFGGQIPSGTIGQIYWLDQIGKMYGAGSQQYNDAKAALALQNKALQTKMAYQQALAQTLPERSLSTQGKLITEGARSGQGLAPSGQAWNQAVFGQLPQQNSQQAGNSPVQIPFQAAGTLPSAQYSAQSQNNTQLAPGTPQDLENQYKLNILKKTVSPQTLGKVLYATNAEKTFNNFNPDDLLRYAGAQGKLAKGYQSLLVPSGKESPEYDRYIEAKSAATLLTHQLRQFYGDSIQPSVMDAWEKLINSDEWATNPTLARKKFDTLKRIIGQEMATYRQALVTPGVYGSQGSNVGTTPSEVPRRTSDQMVRMRSSDGKLYRVPADKRDIFVKNGFKEVGNG